VKELPRSPSLDDESFRWDCPYCARPHLSPIPSDLAVGDRVNIRCPSNGLWIESRVAELVSPATKESSASAIRSRLGEIRRWLRGFKRKSRL
jgi:hypothetical protein